MRYGGVHFRPQSLALATVLAVSLTCVGCLLFDATAEAKVAGVLVGGYIVASLFLHPRHSLVSDPFAIHNLLRVNLLIGGVFSCLYVSSPTATFNEDLVLVALAVTLLTTILADVGVFFVLGAQAEHEPRALETSRGAFRFVFALFLAGWGWRLYAFTHGYLQGTLIGTQIEMSAASNLFAVLNNVSTVAMWGCVVFIRKPLRAAPIVAVEILWLLVTGSKAATLYILLPFFMVLYRRGRIRIDPKFVSGILVLLVVFACSFILIQGYRVAVAKQILAVGHENLDPVGAVQDIEIAAADFQLVAEALTERLNFAERFLMILVRDRNEPGEPWLGRSYLTTLLWAVPRAIWPDKPRMSLGKYFANEYLGWEEESRSEAGITLWGEGFLNFGLLGAVIVPGLWMIAIQWVYAMTIRLGKWGLYFVAASYMLMVNSLSANLSMVVAGISQLALQILLIRFAVETPPLLIREWLERRHV